MIRVLVTGVGSLLGQGILKSIQNSKLKCNLVGTDYFPSAVGLYWVESGYILPDILKPDIQEEEWIDCLVDIIKKEKIDLVAAVCIVVWGLFAVIVILISCCCLSFFVVCKWFLVLN